MVMRLPERDAVSLTRQKLNADLCVAFGGRIAEELIFGYEKVTPARNPTSRWRPAWRAPW
jgi:cell division protease FtsH